MPRVWLITKKMSAHQAQHGFSVVEVLLAATVLAFLVTALTGALIYGRAATADSGDHNRAMMLAEEGLEAARNIRDSGFANLTVGTTGIIQSGGTWIQSGVNDVTDSKYTRTLAVSTLDATRKNVVSTVTWGSNSVSVDARLSNWMSTYAASGPIMMAYSKTTTTPFYRIWDGTNWSAEGSASAVVGNINYVVLKSSEVRNEVILGTQTSTGAIYIQIWNGTSWGNLTQVGAGSTTTRSFDIAYEKTTGNALIAYSSGADFAYRTWDGTTLSGATTVTAPPTTGAVNWLELRQNPVSGSNEIAMIMMDATTGVYGMRWTGSAWNNMGTAATWDTTASNAARKGIDVEYERTSGHIMFAWSDSTSTDLRYRTWNGTTLSGATLLDIPAMGGVGNWVQMDARPSSDEIMLGVQDAGADINTRKWSGTAWDTVTQHPEHEATAENAASRNFDITWETHSSNLGKAWLVWGDGATRSERQWSGTAWGAINVASGSDDTSFVRLRADSVSGAVFSGIYQCSCSAGANRDINERHLTSGSSTWTSSNQLWGGPTTIDPVHFRIDIATPF